MTMPTNLPAPQWTVIAQQETRQQAQNGQFVNGVLVTYRTADGVTGSVFVSDRDYTPAIVKAQISDRVTLHRQIRELSG